MVRAAATSINAQTVREGLVRHRWTAEQLTELEAYYAQLDFLHDYETTMRGERAFCLGGIDYMRRKGWKAASMQVSDEKSGQMVDSGPLWILPSGWCYQNMLNVSDFTSSSRCQRSTKKRGGLILSFYQGRDRVGELPAAWSIQHLSADAGPGPG